MDFETLVLFFGAAAELLVNLVAIPLSVLNLCVLARTSVIHPNMKCILIFQSFILLTRGFCRFVICLFKFVLFDPIGAEYGAFFPPLTKVYFFGIYARNFVLHVLIIERVLATVLVRSYEQQRGHLFTLAWCPFAMAFAFYVSISSATRSSFKLSKSLIMTSVQFVVGAVELAIFYQLCRYNSLSYQKMLHSQRSTHNLSLRYQLSENIRIGKQLIPPLSLNLCNIATATVVMLWSYFELPKYHLLYVLIAFLASIIGLLIELFIITCHPYLKRDLCQILHKFGKRFGLNLIRNNRRIGDETAAANVNVLDMNSAAGIAQRDLISGRTMIEHSKPEEHFAILKNAWEGTNIRTTNGRVM
ncbi:hypothetical protein niasHS_015161 [Heterodera schachtii]|uniref:Gustatory receptor n=2 Tax=Heterodera TaxID=34509 RepID=A0ABD2I4Y0_HETSC